MSARRRRRLLALLSSLALAACALEQRMAIEVIDAPLRTRGAEVRASEAPRGELLLGPYAVRGIARDVQTRGEPLLADDQARPSTFHDLSFDLAIDQRIWRTKCRAQRRIARNADLSAATDEAHDEIALACTLVDPEARAWSLSALGDVGNGLSGEVFGGEPRVQAFAVEVFARRTFLRAIGRELPFPVAQLRRGQVAAAAMLLDSPERAWLAPGLPTAERELAIAVMFALRLLPLAEGPI